MIKAFLSISIISTMSFSCGEKAEKEKFLIPQDFRGRIVVFYNQKKGDEKEYIDKFRIYRIPSNGILLTKFKENHGIQDVDKNEIVFVFKDSVTNKEDTISIAPIKAEQERVYVFYGNTGKINDYFYYECIIDNPKNIQNYFIKNAQGIRIEPIDKWEKILKSVGLNVR